MRGEREKGKRERGRPNPMAQYISNKSIWWPSCAVLARSCSFLALTRTLSTTPLHNPSPQLASLVTFISLLSPLHSLPPPSPSRPNPHLPPILLHHHLKLHLPRDKDVCDNILPPSNPHPPPPHLPSPQPNGPQRCLPPPHPPPPKNTTTPTTR
jgi:hypothetical protein